MWVFEFVFTHDFGGGFETLAEIGRAQNMRWSMVEDRLEVDRANVDRLERDISGYGVNVDQEHGIIIVGFGNQPLQHVTLGLDVDVGSRRRDIVEHDPLARLGLVDSGQLRVKLGRDIVPLVFFADGDSDFGLGFLGLRKQVKQKILVGFNFLSVILQNQIIALNGRFEIVG